MTVLNIHQTLQSLLSLYEFRQSTRSVSKSATVAQTEMTGYYILLCIGGSHQKAKSYVSSADEFACARYYMSLPTAAKEAAPICTAWRVCLGTARCDLKHIFSVESSDCGRQLCSSISVGQVAAFLDAKSFDLRDFLTVRVHHGYSCVRVPEHLKNFCIAVFL